MTDKRDTVYVDLDVDFIRPEHIQIIQQASRIGDVIVALRTDDTGLARRASDLTFRDRRMVVENIRGVKKVVEQQPDYVTNLRILQPKFFVHGGDWDEGAGASDRGAIESALLEWGGQLLEVEKLADFAPTQGPPELKRTIVTPESRRGKIRELLAQRHFVRLLEAHNGLSGLIVEQTRVQSGDETLEFDGMWGSSLTDSTAKGRPDTACVDLTSRLQTIGQILDVTTKPFVFDGDNGGSIEFFRYMVKTLERLGVSAVIIEDKIGVKRNSMFGGEAVQTQDDIYAFCLKIAEGKRAQVTKEFMVIARIESFISQAGLSDAMKRAEAYIDAGADGIMIHSKLSEPDEIRSFCEQYRRLSSQVPLVAVPSTYDGATEQMLMDMGVDLVIYANHLLRAAYPAMVRTAETILKHGRAREVSEFCMPIPELIRLIPESD
jgi:phosphoenolpyruvate phosphomutase